MDKWEYLNKPCYLENHVVRELCKRRTNCTSTPLLTPIFVLVKSLVNQKLGLSSIPIPLLKGFALQRGVFKTKQLRSVLGKFLRLKIFKHCCFKFGCPKNSLSTVAHTIDCVCSKILNHGLNHGLLFSLWEHSYMKSDVFWVFLTYLPTLNRWFTT